MYLIEMRIAGGEWDTDHMGQNDPVESRNEAEAGIEALLALGDEWTDAEYRVVEIG